MEKRSPMSLPTFQNRATMWAVLDFPVVSESYPRTYEYVAALRTRFSNGSVVFHSFRLPEHPVLEWYFERNQLHECNFFERFWQALTVATKIPYKLAPLNFYERSIFEWCTPFQLGGNLSALIFSGGAYSSSTGYGPEARRLGEGAAAELLAGDYEQTLFFQSHAAWSDFFMDIAWDYTAIVLSKPSRLVHVILATDLD